MTEGRIAELRALLVEYQSERNDVRAELAMQILSNNAVHCLPALLDCAEALRWLLQDTQHAEHECDDETCPVAAARAALAKLDN